MTENCVWKKAQTVELKVSENILPEFNIGFDKKIPTEVEQELRSFVTWVENNYRIPITLWVDFEYNHYLISRSGKRVGYLFYWVDFSSYPVFDNEDDIPLIRLPVRTEHSTIEEILASFIEALEKGFEEKEYRFKIEGEDFKPYGQNALKTFEERAKAKGYQVAPNSYEGVRITFDTEEVKGWLLLRMSLHDPQMPLNVEGVREGDCDKLYNIVLELLEGFDRLVKPL